MFLENQLRGIVFKGSRQCVNTSNICQLSNIFMSPSQSLSGTEKMQALETKALPKREAI